MPATATKPILKARAKSERGNTKPARSANGTVDVLTLAEAAKYLRVRETDVLAAITEQNLPARHVGNAWRILKSAIQQWLMTPKVKTGKSAFQSLAGAWNEDPSVEPMLAEIYRHRGRSAEETSS